MAVALASCFPTLTPVDPTAANAPVIFSCSDGECVITAQEPITEVYAALDGPVASRYCSGAVTVQPRPCAPVAGNWRALDLPLGDYGLMVTVGRVDKPLGPLSFADINTEAGSFRAELRP